MLELIQDLVTYLNIQELTTVFCILAVPYVVRKNYSLSNKVKDLATSVKRFQGSDDCVRLRKYMDEQIGNLLDIIHNKNKNILPHNRNMLFTVAMFQLLLQIYTSKSESCIDRASKILAILASSHVNIDEDLTIESIFTDAKIIVTSTIGMLDTHFGDKIADKIPSCVHKNVVDKVREVLLP